MSQQKITLGFQYTSTDFKNLVKDGRFIENVFAFRRQFKYNVEAELQTKVGDYEFADMLRIDEKWTADGYECVFSALI